MKKIFNITTKFTKKYSKSKIFNSAKEAVADIKDGQTLCVGGFGLCKYILFLNIFKV
jgi:hypothetical protein